MAAGSASIISRKRRSLSRSASSGDACPAINDSAGRRSSLPIKSCPLPIAGTTKYSAVAFIITPLFESKCTHRNGRASPAQHLLRYGACTYLHSTKGNSRHLGAARARESVRLFLLKTSRRTCDSEQLANGRRDHERLSESARVLGA